LQLFRQRLVPNSGGQPDVDLGYDKNKTENKNWCLWSGVSLIPEYDMMKMFLPA